MVCSKLKFETTPQREIQRKTKRRPKENPSIPNDPPRELSEKIELIPQKSG